MSYHEPVRYCWLCDIPVNGLIFDRHYLTGEYVYFCSREHWCTHRILRDL